MTDDMKPSERLAAAMEFYEHWRTAQPHVIAAFEEYERQIDNLSARVAELEHDKALRDAYALETAERDRS